jgi:hypothetical protein
MNKNSEPIYIDVFQCEKCEEFKSGLEVGTIRKFPFSKPYKLEITCKDCKLKEVKNES